MSRSLRELTEEAMKLPLSSRILLAERLVQSVESEEPDEIQELWSAEAIRRRDEVRSGKVQAISGEEVVNEVRRLVGR
jgi:putative addiction module component (TIGR02574 family)